jgi:4'-phosphopantetheinyl transferase
MWSSPPSLLSLPSNEAHVWRIALEQPADVQDNFLRTLDQDERTRANRFHFEKHQRRFVVARGFLRSLLARYLDITPEEVRFSYGPYGKPALSGEHRNSGLRFNASHSHELAIYAFVQDYEVGVDVEHINESFASEDIARHFFSSYEVQTLLALPEAERAAAFFRCWTRKEAYIKAIGSGLSHPLDEFDVTLAPNEPAALLRVQREPDSVARWSLFNLDVGDGYAGALAVEGAIHRLHGFTVVAG